MVYVVELSELTDAERIEFERAIGMFDFERVLNPPAVLAIATIADADAMSIVKAWEVYRKENKHA